MYPSSKMNATQKRNQTRKHANFNVHYNSIRVNGTQLTRAQIVEQPSIHFKPKKDKYYTILMYDLHSPKPAYLHYMAINSTDPSSIRPIVPYQPPAPPPTDTHFHVYMFVLYEQPGFLTITPPSSRSGFDPDAFASSLSLKKRAQHGFYVNPRA